MKEFAIAVVLCSTLGLWAYTYGKAIERMYPTTIEVRYGK